MDKNKELGFSYQLITISQDKVSSEEPLFLIKRGSECDREDITPARCCYSGRVNHKGITYLFEKWRHRLRFSSSLASSPFHLSIKRWS
ncbi:LOW QUALITY PROTEIN: hypothetical protein YC2023_050467 [Brassica napus]